ncbi:MAG TPA: hypothetical protein VGC88_06465 [Terriglobales bacterium]
MSDDVHQQLSELLENPAPESDIAAAKRFGVDLYALLENLKQTPSERMQRLDSLRSFFDAVRPDRRSEW